MGEVTVAAGTLNEHVIDSGIDLRIPDWLPAGFRPYYYHITDGQGSESARWRDVGRQLAPPGEYALTFHQSEHSHRDVPWHSVTVPAHGIVQVKRSK